LMTWLCPRVQILLFAGFACRNTGGDRHTAGIRDPSDCAWQPDRSGHRWSYPVSSAGSVAKGTFPPRAPGNLYCRTSVPELLTIIGAEALAPLTDGVAPALGILQRRERYCGWITR
jgi:hypothetical protein